MGEVREMSSFERKFRARAKRVCTQQRPKDDAVAEVLELKWWSDEHPYGELLGYFPNTRFQRLLGRLGACYEGRLAVGAKSMSEWWLGTHRADWMRWLVSSVYIHTSGVSFPPNSRAAQLLAAEDHYSLTAHQIRKRLPKLRLPKHAGDLA
jgi:hypothetical protein